MSLWVKPDQLTAFTTTTGTFSLGVNWWDPPFQGSLDELNVYDEALTDDEVTALAQR